MSHYSIWTDEMVALLRTLWAQGHSYSKIGKVITATHKVEVSRAAALGKANRLGLLRKAPDDAASRRERSSQIGRQGTRTRRASGSLPPITSKPFVARAIVAGEHSKPLIELDAHRCKFPVSGEGVKLVVCGEVATHGSYCENCARVAFIPKKSVA